MEQPVWQSSERVFAIGDVDGDNISEFAIQVHWGAAAPNWLSVYSPLHGQPLWTCTGSLTTGYGYFGKYTIGLNLDNDTNREIVTSTSEYNDSRIFAYDHDGTLLYTFNLQPPASEWMRGLGSVGDIDGDGADDFGVGLVETTGRGAIQLYSGRSGRALRRDLGPLPGDAIGSQVVGVGDFDRDGVPDYAASSYLGFRGVAVIYSGATGQMLRQWSGEQGLAEKLVGGPDFDLDGVPDVFAGGPRHFNPTGWTGRIQVLSGRDGGLLWDEWNAPSTELGALYQPDRELGTGLANLGPLPGNPYPVVVVWDRPYKIIGYQGTIPIVLHSPRLRAICVGLAGTDVQGIGCSSTGAPPQNAVRSDSGGLRITLAGARANALAWLLVGPQGSTSWQGIPLPYGLGSWSLPGCYLLVPADLIFARVTGSGGWNEGYTLVTAPFTVATTGLGVATQWFVFNPATSDYGMTPRHELRIQ
ncbi:MAG TPA: hypothetical protein VFD82_02265 [Planctomycetota bacterium]|nr:hypothetical protein [Planctomycetota bacterium]